MEIDGKLLVMAIAVGALLVFSVVQATQLLGLSSSVSSLSENKVAQPSSSSSGGSSQTLKKSLNNLPGMVGGC